jgi:hypothetical protein
MKNNNSKLILVAVLAVSQMMVGCAGTGSSSGTSANSGLAPVGVYDSAGGVVKSRLVFDVDSNQGADAQAKNFLKKMTDLASLLMSGPESFASGTCTGHTGCNDFVDISVTNTGLTTFTMDKTAVTNYASGTNSATDTIANAILAIGTLKIATLYDNDLASCAAASCGVLVSSGTCGAQPGCTWGGSTCTGTPTAKKCTTANINIYTDNEGLVITTPAAPASCAGQTTSALCTNLSPCAWNSGTSTCSGTAAPTFTVGGLVNLAKSNATTEIQVPLNAAGTNTATALVDQSATGGPTSHVLLETITIPAATQVIDQSYFPIGGEAGTTAGVSASPSPSGTGYALTANFTTASSGTYKARVVVEYVLH